VTEDEFKKRRWKPFELVVFSNDYSGKLAEAYRFEMDCIVLAIDFEEGLLKVIPLYPSEYKFDPPDGFYANHAHITIKKRGMEVIHNKKNYKQIV